MEIGVIFSSKDPEQLETRNFIRDFINERGILAKYYELDRPVDSPRIVIDGETLFDQRENRRLNQKQKFPDIKAVAKRLEYHSWCL